MDDIATACEAIMDVIRELIIDRAFDKKIKLSKRIPFIIIYVIILSGLTVLLGFLCFNFIIRNNYFGLLFLIMAILSLFMLIYPFVFYKKNNNWRNYD